MVKKQFDLATLIPEVNEIQDADIRQKTIDIWQALFQESKWEDIMKLPVSPHTKDYPHMVHNRAVVKMAIASADVLEEIHGVKINRDYLISAALLQDASKLVEYEPDEKDIVKHSDIGARFPHGFYVAHLATAAKLPNEIVQSIITHTPDAAEFPKTVIGKILFYTDQIDMAGLKGDRWRKIVSIYR